MAQDMNLDDPKVHEHILAQVFRLDRNLKAMGLGPMDPLQLRSTYAKIKQAVAQLVAQKGQTTAPAGPRPMMQALPPAPTPQVPMSMLAEGGDIADSSGKYTQQVRQRYGIR